LEICFILHPDYKLSYKANGFVQLLSSSLIGVLIIARYFNKRVEPITINRGQTYWPLFFWLLAIPLLGALANYYYLVDPISVNNSDIIPLVQVMGRRFMSGATVYEPVNDFGYLMHPNYMPAHWMPYVLAPLAHIDPRWIAFSIWSAAILAVVNYSRNGSREWQSGVVILLCLFLFLLITTYQQGILTLTVELMVAGYYMLLILGIAGKNPWLNGLAISLCLLSRYSLVLWLPLWLMVEFMHNGWRESLKPVGTVALCVLLIYVIPFLWGNWHSIIDAYGYYSVSAVGEWLHYDASGRPAHLYAGNGFAWWFYEHFSNYSVPDRVKSLQKAHLLFSFLTIAALAAFYLLFRKKTYAKAFLLGSFKIYLGVFLAFIQVPYTYLMITEAFVSIAIFAVLGQWRIIGRTSNAQIPDVIGTLDMSSL
jgi:hypothetical protein